MTKRGAMTEGEAKRLVQELNTAIARTVELTGELKKQIAYVEFQIECMIRAFNK